MQFGEPIGGIVTEPGLHWRLPFIQEVRRFDKRMLDWDGDVSQIPTLGREFIIVDTTARWRIADPLQFLRSVRDETGARTRLDDILDSATRDVVSGTELEEIVRSADWDVDVSQLAEEDAAALEQTDLERPNLGREQLERDMLTAATRQMPSLGIELVDVRIKRINYIDSVRDQVESRMISERQSIAARFRSEGEGRSQEILGNMERELRRIVGNRIGSDVLTVGRVEIANRARDEIQEAMDRYENGIRIITVELQDVVPPLRVQPAFNEVNEARQELERMVNDATRQANEAIPRAEGTAKRTIAEAEGYATERVNRALGEAARFTSILEEYRGVPEVTRSRLYLETLNEVLPRIGSVVVVQDGQAGPFPLLNLPSAQRPLQNQAASQ